ncbi:MAG: carboxypeptidase regulatory-like domain-containing protein, partial [Acidobacteriia bacterium]|nr:carboxypeptidase regulatory-like domain-containing protein [Terriglobia bacterium]
MTLGRLVSLSVIAVVCGPIGLAQSSYALYGRILDPSLANVSGALISVVNEDTGFRHVVNSAPDGTYTAGSLGAG